MTKPDTDRAMPDSGTPGMTKGLTHYGDPGFSLFLRKAFIKGAGFTDSALARPVIGITNTGSAYNPCHGNAPQLIEAVKRGVMLAGGLPMDFPTISIHESFSQPTSMFLRNLMSMDTEELLRAQPMDAVVLIGGCDKTVPAQLMGAASAGLPAVQQHLKAGKLKMIAITTPQRAPGAPDYKTVAEQGFANFNAAPWAGFFAPKGTPKSVVDKLALDLADALKQADVAQKMNDLGSTVVGNKPVEFRQFVTRQIEMWAEGVKISGATVD